MMTLRPGYRERPKRLPRTMALLTFFCTWLFFGMAMALFLRWEFGPAWLCLALAGGFHGAGRLWEKW